MTNKEFEKSIKGVMAERTHFEPEDMHWNAIRNVLHPQKKRRIIWIFLFLLIGAGITFSIMKINNQNIKKPSRNKSEIIVQSNLENSPNEKLAISFSNKTTPLNENDLQNFVKKTPLKKDVISVPKFYSAENKMDQAGEESFESNLNFSADEIRESILIPTLNNKIFTLNYNKEIPVLVDVKNSMIEPIKQKLKSSFFVGIEVAMSYNTYIPNLQDNVFIEEIQVLTSTNLKRLSPSLNFGYSKELSRSITLKAFGNLVMAPQTYSYFTSSPVFVQEGVKEIELRFISKKTLTASSSNGYIYLGGIGIALEKSIKSFFIEAGSGLEGRKSGVIGMNGKISVGKSFTFQGNQFEAYWFYRQTFKSFRNATEALHTFPKFVGIGLSKNF